MMDSLKCKSRVGEPPPDIVVLQGLLQVKVFVWSIISQGVPSKEPLAQTAFIDDSCPHWRGQNYSPHILEWQVCSRGVLRVCITSSLQRNLF